MSQRTFDRIIILAATLIILGIIVSEMAAADRIVFVDQVKRCEFVAQPTQPVSFTTEPELPKGYPVRSGWWTINGGYPPREEVIRHLQSGQHAGKFDASWLKTLTHAELHSLHSDDHECRVADQSTERVTCRPTTATADPGRLLRGERQIVVVTAPWCGPCRTWKQRQRPRLVASGWEFGANGHFREVGRYAGIRSYPSFVLEIDGRAVKTLSGYQTAEQLDALYRSEI